jgi:FkbM family methyltransferase
MSFIDRKGQPVDIDFEIDQCVLVKSFMSKNAKVLELGARYGTVSCLISELLDEPTQHVAVEPDPSVIEALEKNKINNSGQFHVYNGVISKDAYTINTVTPSHKYYEYATYTTKCDDSASSSLQHMSLEALQRHYDIEFDTLIADCEGFLCDFVEENEEMMKQFRLIIFEKDGTPWSVLEKRYEKMEETLVNLGFKRKYSIPHPEYKNNPHLHNVWVRTSEL